MAWRRLFCLLLGFAGFVEQGLAQQDPFALIKYDSVVGYNFGLYMPRRSILKNDSTLDETTVLPGRTLTTGQTRDLLARLNNKRTYGGPAYACFEPRHSFVFYRGTSVAALIEICFGCNNLSSKPEIPAVNYYFNKGGQEYSNYGFSEKGADWLMDFCRRLGLEVPPVVRPNN